MLSDTFQTLLTVPFFALTPEITQDYDERTSLTGYRMFFNLLASLVTAVAAPAIVDSILASGGTQQQGYMLIAALFGFGGIAVGAAEIAKFLFFVFLVLFIVSLFPSVLGWVFFAKTLPDGVARTRELLKQLAWRMGIFRALTGWRD